MNIVLNVTETERWSVLTQCIEGEFCLAEEIESEKGNGTYVLNDVCQVSFIEEILSSENIETVIVFYQQAEYYLAEKIRNGVELIYASEEWMGSLCQLTLLQKKNRTRIKLYNIEQALGEIPVLKNSLNSFGISVLNEHESEVSERDIYFLCACQFVLQTDEFKNFNRFMQAVSYPFKASNRIKIDVEKLIRFLEKNKGLIRGMEQENRLISKQIVRSHKCIEERIFMLRDENRKYKKLLLDNDKLKDLYDSLNEKSEEMVRERIDLLSKLKTVETENSLLIKQLQNVQNEIEAIFFNKENNNSVHQKVGNECSKIDFKKSFLIKEYKLSILEEEVKALKKSYIWKVTKPLRLLRKIIFSKKTKFRDSESVEAILLSDLFDSEWYLAQYPDVADSKINPAEHYLRFGAVEHRLPSQLFDGDRYIEKYPDVAGSGMNPLLHYIKFGENEGRSIPKK